ncbi:OLC1v1017184C1 [Oldenlandia corymbosa var. corymbosa]|uniref:OLC1v1017184C1 n=1 Tax=Oldenlandia corymbosa var. corymbosa TaxID=529605 RepID=A0AAV1E8U0_OLDCO|nr:OLC1v1017184C1 [Oldenlandia corymbosa var. corymbosa]
MVDFRTQSDKPFLDWIQDSSISQMFDSSLLPEELVDNNAGLAEAALCVPGSRLVSTDNISKENVVKFVNAGGGDIKEDGELGILVMSDHGFDGGDVLRTNEIVIDDSTFGVLYQSARIGNFTYQFEDLPAGDYLVDLHFAEIINTYGPKGMRVFDVLVQDKKVLSELDIYSIVGANKPLRLEDVRVTVTANGLLSIRFQGLCGSPIVSGICIKEEPKFPAFQESRRYSEVNSFSFENKDLEVRSNAKYQRKIEELQAQCQQKTDECYQAWMSLTDLNKKLEDARIELDNKCFQNHSLGQEMAQLAKKLKDVSRKYEYGKTLWLGSVNELQLKVKIMKDEQIKLSQEAKESAKLIPDLTRMFTAIQELVLQSEDIKLKYSKEQAERKKLYNQVQETRGNIRVFCRCRPLSREQASAGHATVVDFDAAKDGYIGILPIGSAKKTYKFDRVFLPKDDQENVFADASPLVISVLDGYNVCIFAYGQTGTGKTYTMEGTENNRGVNYRTLELLFRMVEDRKETFVYRLSVNVLEVYNEQIRDLLVDSPASKRLEVRQVSEGANPVPGLVTAEVDSIEEVWKVLQTGNNARATGSNNVNEHSSRSHCMICITVAAKNLINGECTKSKLWLVDLAGSERLGKTDVQGERLKEAQNINRSLSALGDVISALASKSNHIPYRNSKLTHILQDSLGGDSKTLMFVQISPLEQDLGETLSSLNFATRVRGVELGPAKKQIDLGELQKLKLQLDKSKQESKSKDEALQKLEENLRILESKAKGKEQFGRSQQDKVNELENQLLLKADLCRQMDRQLTELSMKVRVGEDVRVNLQQKLHDMEKRLSERDDTESTVLQQKVKQLEKTLKVRTEEFDVQTAILQKKVKELEQKLEKQGGSIGNLLHKKIEELEEKLTESDKHLESLLPFGASDEKSQISSKARQATSIDGEMKSDPWTQGLKSRNRLSGQNSVLLKGTESLNHLRQKQDYQNRRSEINSLSLSMNRSTEKKLSLPAEPNIGRHSIDPSKAFARVTRTTKSFSSRISREPAPLIKERGTSARVWL